MCATSNLGNFEYSTYQKSLEIAEVSEDDLTGFNIKLEYYSPAPGGIHLRILVIYTSCQSYIIKNNTEVYSAPIYLSTISSIT